MRGALPSIRNCQERGSIFDSDIADSNSVARSVGIGVGFKDRGGQGRKLWRCDLATEVGRVRPIVCSACGKHMDVPGQMLLIDLM